MKQLFQLILASACLVIGSCTTAQRYYQAHSKSPSQPWEGSNGSWGGYRESPAGNGKFDIEYTAFNKPTREAVSYFTMLRAAERTLIEKRTEFYISKPLKLQSDSQESYFPAYVVPGRWEIESVRHTTRNPYTGELSYHYDDVRIWYPEQYMPERYVTNYIHQSTMRISFNGSGRKYNAVQIANDALLDKQGYGKPKLDPRAMRMLGN